MAFGRSRGKMYAQEDLGITFDDVAGIDEAVEELREVVEFLRSPEKYQVLGGHIPKGVLLMGPPGTGKTAFGNWLAQALDMPHMVIKASELLRPYVGETEQHMAQAFEAARQQKALLQFDEVDGNPPETHRAEK